MRRSTPPADLPTVRSLLTLFAALALLLPQGAFAASGEIILKREPGLSAAERADVRADAGVRFEEALEPARMEVVRAAPGDADAAVAALRANPDVEYAVPNVRLRAATDPRFGDQWGFEQASDMDIDLLSAWRAAPRRGAGVRVGVVDGGVHVGHREFAGRIAGGRSFVTQDCDDEDGDGADHGTHVTGTIGAAVDAAGTVGVAPAASLVTVRALDSCGSGELGWILNALDAAADAGARVVNASLGTLPERDPLAAAAFDRVFADVFAGHPNVLYVVSAGNEFNDTDERPVYPCAASAANVVCVGASTRFDARVQSSNRGVRTVDLFAPGQAILSTVRDGYREMTGTSMAAPHVTGIAALQLNKNPYATPGQLKAALLGGADRVPALAGMSVTGGRANAYNAIARTPIYQPPDSDRDGVPDASDRCPVTPAPGGCPPPPPPPPDTDGDGRVDSADACVTEAAATADGCPIPAFAALTAKAGTCEKGKRRVRCVRVTVRTDRTATARVTVERKRCKRKRCRWRRLARRTVATESNRARVVVKRLKKGSHRAVVTLSSNAGTSKARTRRFRVR